MTCKHGDQVCGTTTYQCGKCEREDYENAGRRMSQKDYEYDRMVTSPSYGRDDDDE